MEARMISRGQAAIEVVGHGAFPVQSCPESMRPVAATPLLGGVMYRCLLERFTTHHSACEECLFSGTIKIPWVVDIPSTEKVEEGEEVPIPMAVKNWPHRSWMQIN